MKQISNDLIFIYIDIYCPLITVSSSVLHVKLYELAMVHSLFITTQCENGYTSKSLTLKDTYIHSLIKVIHTDDIYFYVHFQRAFFYDVEK